MENPQAQMPQGQPGMAPEQMQQGQPQQGGQDQQMQQIMQMVQQMMQQGAQPVDAAAELLGQQVPPEIIMQVFVQMGMPEQDAQMAIEQAMQGGQQPQGQGEEQMAAEQQMMQQGAPEEGGQPSPAEEIQMRYGGRMPRRLRSFANGGDNQEMEAVMQQVQDMMSQGANAKQVMEQIQAAAQQGQISPETATTVLEQLSGMQQAENPQGDDATMAANSQDPQMMDPNMATPDSAMGMAKFGGNLKKLMSRAYGGQAVAPGTDSKTYAKDRTSMFVNAVKNNAFKSTLDDDFPSLSGNQMAYGGSLPKATKGIIMKDNKLTIDPTQFKSEAEYKAAVLDWNMDSANKDNQVTGELLKTNTWKEPELKPEAGKQYELDTATGKLKVVVPKNQFQFQEGDIMGQDAQGTYVTRKDGSMMRVPSNQMQGAQTYNSQINPVAYQNPYGTGLFGNLAASASPFGRMVANFGANNMYDPRITGTNLPGGMSGQQFLGAIGANGIVPGMAGTAAGQNWRIGQGEEFKEGSIWRGNRRKGVRYQIDWGDAAAMNPAGPQNNFATTTNPAAVTNPNYNSKSLEDREAIDQGLQYSGQTTQPVTTSNASYQIDDNEYNPLAAKDNREYNSSSPVVNQPSAVVVANQNTVAPGSTNVVNPASEVNATDQTVTPVVDNSALNVTKVTDEEIEGGRKSNKYDRQSDKQVAKETKIGANESFKNYEDIVSEFDKKDAQTIRNDYNQMYQTYGKNEADQMMNDSYMDRKLKERNDKIEKKLNKPEKNYSKPNRMRDLAYGGNVDPVALENAIALINRAFGGRIPKAVNGINLGSEDTDANKIPDYLQAENLPTNPFGNNGTLEQSAGKKMNIDWRGVAGAAGDVYMNNATKLTNFANEMNQLNPAYDNAKLSAVNRPSNDFTTMNKGSYDQWGNAFVDDRGNESFNPTDSNYSNQSQIFAYGGKVYEIGGEVDLDDDEMEQLAAAGFKLSRV